MRLEPPNPNAPGEMGLDSRLAEVRRAPAELEARANALKVLLDAKVPFLVGGAYAYATYTGIWRDTKDLDLFIREHDGNAALNALEEAGWTGERYVHGWLHKAYWDDYLVDLIFASGNGITVVDDEWFEHASTAEVLGMQVQLPPPEEIFWSKAFILERHRFDGAELNHLILRTGPEMDWTRVLRRFDGHWELLLGHLMFFRYAYPSERKCVPDWLVDELLERTRQTVREGNWHERICRGTFTSGVNYGVDVAEWGFIDGRDFAELRQEGDHEPGSTVH